MTLRLLLVHAHPDDETLTHGATVAAALAHGHDVHLVTCTRGEEGEVIGEAEQHRTSDRDDTLDELREAELAAALEALAAGTGRRSGTRGSTASRPAPARPGRGRATGTAAWSCSPAGAPPCRPTSARTASRSPTSTRRRAAWPGSSAACARTSCSPTARTADTATPTT